MDTTDRTHRLGLPYLANDQAQKHVTVNEGLRALDALVHTSVISAGSDAQPDAPTAGDAYLMTAGRTGTAWSGYAEGDLAAFQDGAWTVFAPRTGMTVYVEDEARHRVWDGQGWVATATDGSGGGPAPGPTEPQTTAPLFGVNASADDTNRLTVKSDAVLHSHDDATGQGSGDVRHVLNKAAPGGTASFVFQSGFSGRAEMGLTGSDDFSFKVSADGAAFKEALRIDRTTGAVAFPNTDLGSAAATGGAGFADTLFEAEIAAFSVSHRGFRTVPYDSGLTDPGGNWDAGTHQYVVPEDGIYACFGSIRPDDGAEVHLHFGFGIHTANRDNSRFNWTTTPQNVNGSSNRYTMPYNRLGYFSAGERLRAIMYVDSASATNQNFKASSMQILRIA